MHLAELLPEWSCLEGAHLVQDQEAKSQEGGELPEAHDASAREESRYHRPSSEFYEPTHLESGLPCAGNSLAPWLRLLPSLPLTGLCFVVSMAAKWHAGRSREPAYAWFSKSAGATVAGHLGDEVSVHSRPPANPSHCLSHTCCPRLH